MNARLLLSASLVAIVAAWTSSVPQAAAPISVTFPSRLAAGPDYATDVLGDAWDMCNREDISPFPNDLVGFSSFSFATSPCRAGGATQFVNGGVDSSVTFLYRGIYGVINPGRNGRNFPIDTGKYQVLSYKLSSTLANEDPQIYWFHNPYAHPAGEGGGVRLGPRTVGGTQISVADLTQQLNGSPWWNGPVSGLRIDPNLYNAGQSVFFHWVRLTSPTAAIHPIVWAGGSGPAAIQVRDNSDSTLLIVASGLSSSPYYWNYGVLPPGSYTVIVSTADGSSGSANFTINHPPTIQVTDPSPTSGEDYATAVFGNPWDMNDPADLQITGIEHTTPIAFGGGLASATNTTGDPNLSLLFTTNDSVPVDTHKYRYLTVRFQVDGPFDLSLGSVARLFWSSQRAGALGAAATTSKDILVWPGMNSYTVDLASLSTAPDGGLVSGEAWTASSKRSLRFDPHEIPQPRTFHIDDVKLTAKPVSTGFFTIRFAGGDADGDYTSVSLYYDTDTNAANGKTPIASGIPMSAGQFGWNTRGVLAGDYYVYAEATDGIQTIGRYSQIPVEVSLITGPSRDGDFDGDGQADISVFRPSTGAWYIRGSSASATYLFGEGGDVPVAGDYDGDGKADIAVFRPSTGVWYIVHSSTMIGTMIAWGGNGDIPVPADYDGDGKADVAVFRPTTGIWYIVHSSTMIGTMIAWGGNADIPVPGDYDGDGKGDIAVFRPSTGIWYIVHSSTMTGTALTFGGGGDIPVPSDYDGDGKTDIAVFRPYASAWYIIQSSTMVGIVVLWGDSGDIPVPGEYDGDGKGDVAIFRPATGLWYIIQTSTMTGVAIGWGGNGDIPVLKKP
jgi:FG-GAP-like repeat